jgi:hypothetical protein
LQHLQLLKGSAGFVDFRGAAFAGLRGLFDARESSGLPHAVG